MQRADSIKQALLDAAVKGIVPRGTFTDVAKAFNTTKQNVGQTAKRMGIAVERGK